jgi:hypothetical protein
MTQQKIIESRWRNPVGSEANPEDLDATARAVAYAEQYIKSRQAKSAPVEGREYALVEDAPETVFRSVSKNPNTNLINALGPYESKPGSGRGSGNNSKAPSRKNSDSAIDLTGSKVAGQMEELERNYDKNNINIEPAKRTLKSVFKDIKERKDNKYENLKNLQIFAKHMGANSLRRKEENNVRREKKDMNYEDKLRHKNMDRLIQNQALNKLHKVHQNNAVKSTFLRYKEQIQKHKEQIPNFKYPGKVENPPAKENPPPPKETAAATPQKEKKQQEAKQPDAPSKKEGSKSNLFASATAQSYSPAQRIQAINSALTGLKKEFDTQADSQIGVKGAERFLEYGLTINGNSKWSTVKKLLESLSKSTEDLINKGGRKMGEIDKIFQPVLGGKKGQEKTKISQNVLFDDKINTMGFEPPTPEQSRAPSKASGAKK